MRNDPGTKSPIRTVTKPSSQQSVKTGTPTHGPGKVISNSPTGSILNSLASEVSQPQMKQKTTCVDSPAPASITASASHNPIAYNLRPAEALETDLLVFASVPIGIQRHWNRTPKENIRGSRLVDQSHQCSLIGSLIAVNLVRGSSSVSLDGRLRRRTHFQSHNPFLLFTQNFETIPSPLQRTHDRLV